MYCEELTESFTPKLSSRGPRLQTDASYQGFTLGWYRGSIPRLHIKSSHLRASYWSFTSKLLTTLDTGFTSKLHTNTWHWSFSLKLHTDAWYWSFTSKLHTDADTETLPESFMWGFTLRLYTVASQVGFTSRLYSSFFTDFSFEASYQGFTLRLRIKVSHGGFTSKPHQGFTGFIRGFTRLHFESTPRFHRGFTEVSLPRLHNETTPQVHFETSHQGFISRLHTEASHWEYMSHSIHSQLSLFLMFV